jgi:probable rRNA maturation factor
MPSSASEPPSLIVRPGMRVTGRRALSGFAATLQRRLTGGKSFTCLLTGDEELRLLNRRFRGKRRPTDVLSFPSGRPGEGLGDIAVSLDHARRQAREFGHGVSDELRILMLHGALHLLGMDHESDSGEMRRAEAAWRRKLGLPTGLIERVNA